MPQDAVARHLTTDKAIEWGPLSANWPSEPAGSDLPPLGELHRAYVERFDSFRDPERGARIQAAVDAISERAAGGSPPSWVGLREVQALVLGAPGPVPFRSETAYTDARMEVYGADPRLEPALSKLLERCHSADVHPLLAACRSYLHVRFFHPFAEGNGAAARLTFQWSLEARGLRLPELTPLFRARLRPGHEDEYRALIDLAGKIWTGA